MEALRLPASARSAFVASACGDNSALRAYVSHVLAASHDAETDFARPPAILRNSLEANAALEAGSYVGKFRLVRFIAKGGMGQVWEARDEDLRRTVALKLVLPERVDTRSLELFAREARAGGRLAHPNIVTTYAFGESEGRAWIAQEFVSGSRTLKDSLDFVRSTEVTPRSYYKWAAEVTARIADGLQAAHDAGVIHRDVKPQNILIDNDDMPKVADFGLARIADDSFVSWSGEVAGSHAYMSPEQVTAKRKELDHRTDIFSLGIVLYELLTLRRPFEGDTVPQIADRIVSEEPRAAVKARSLCPLELSIVAGKALEKAPSTRYQSARELADDLRRHLAGQPIFARPPSPISRLSRLVARNRWQSTSVGLLLLLMAGASGVFGIQVSESRTRRRSLAEHRRLIETALEDQAPGIARMSLLTLARLGVANQELAAWQMRLTQLESAKAEQLRIAEEESKRIHEQELEEERARLLKRSPTLRQFSGHADQIVAVCLSPDGTTVASGSVDRTIRLCERESCEELWVLEGHHATVTDLAFSADGSQLASAARERKVAVWDVATGSPIRWIDHPANVTSVTFSRDGTQLLTTSENGVAYSWNALSGAAVARFVGHKGPITHAAYSPSGQLVLTASEDRTVRIWGLDGTTQRVLGGHRCIVNTAEFSPDELHVLTASRDGTARTYSIKSGGSELTLEIGTDRCHLGGWGGPVGRASYADQGRMIVTAFDTNVALLFDARTGAFISSLARGELPNGNHPNPKISIVTPSTGGSKVALFGTSTTVKSFSEGNAIHLLTSRMIGAPLVFNKEGTELIGRTRAKYGNYLIYLDLTTPNSGVPRSAPAFRAASVTTSPGNKFIATQIEGRVALWDAAKATRVGVFDRIAGSIVGVSPDGREVVVRRALDGTVQETALFRVLLGSNTDVEADIEALSWQNTVASDGSQIQQRWIEQPLLLDSNGIETHVLSMGRSPADVCLRQDGARAILSGKSASVWDTATGEVVAAFQATGVSASQVTTSSFGPADTVVASGLIGYVDNSKARTALSADSFTPAPKRSGFVVWDAATGTVLQHHPTPLRVVDLISMTPDGRFVWCFDSDGLGCLLRVSDGAVVAQLDSAADLLSIPTKWSSGGKLGSQARIIYRGKSLPLDCYREAISDPELVQTWLDEVWTTDHSTPLPLPPEPPELHAAPTVDSVRLTLSECDVVFSIHTQESSLASPEIAWFVPGDSQSARSLSADIVEPRGESHETEVVARVPLEDLLPLYDASTTLKLRVALKSGASAGRGPVQSRWYSAEVTVPPASSPR